jgi:hypothetical protein
MTQAGMSENMIKETLANDMGTGGRIFGELRNSTKASIVDGINQSAKLGQYENYDLDKGKLAWVSVGGHKVCMDCDGRAGKELTFAEWETEGLPGSGWSVCQGYCYCVLDPTGKMSKKVDAPVTEPGRKVAKPPKKIVTTPKSFKNTHVYSNLPDKEYREAWETWRERVEFGKDPLSSEEAFHHWASYKWRDYKQEFASGKLTSKTTKYMDEVFKTFDGDWNGKTLYRGIELTEENSPIDAMNYFKSLKVGNKIDMDVPQSFTKDINVANSYINDQKNLFNAETDVKVLFRAKKVTKEGYDIEKISLHQAEKEVLIKPNSQFKITNITKESSGIGYKAGEWADDLDVLIIDIEPI